MVIDTTNFGTKQGTEVIQRKSGSKEYYKDGKLVKEINPEGVSVARILVTQSKSGGIKESKPVETLSELAVSLQTERLQEKINQETNNSYRVTANLEKQQFEFQPIQKQIIETPKQQYSRDEFVNLAIQKQNERLGYGITSFEKPEILARQRQGVEYKYNRPETWRSKVWDVFGGASNVPTYKKEETGQRIAYYGAIFGGVTTPLAFYQGSQDIGLVSYGSEYRERYLRGELQQQTQFIELRGEQLVKESDKPWTIDPTDIRQGSQLLGGEYMFAGRQNKEIIKNELIGKYTKAGYDVETSERLASQDIKYTRSIEYGRFVSIVDLNRVTNKLGGELAINYGSKVAGKTILTTAFKKGAVSTLVPGIIEGAGTVYIYETARYNKVSSKDVAIGAIAGGVTAPLIQTSLYYLPAKFPSKFGKLAGGTEQAGLYALDPSEGFGDVADILTSRSAKPSINLARRGITRVKTDIFNIVGSDIISKTDNTYTYTSPVLQKQFSYTYTNTKITSKQPSTAIAPYIQPKAMANIMPKSFTMDTPKNIYLMQKTFPKNDILPLPNGFTSDKTFPIVPSPKPMPMPLTSPMPMNNVFPNVMPDVYPNVMPYTVTNVFVGKTPVIPFLPSGKSGLNYDFSFRPKTRQRKGYLPSLTALGLGIKGKRSKFAELSGLTIRPIVR